MSSGTVDRKIKANISINGVLDDVELMVISDDVRVEITAEGTSFCLGFDRKELLTALGMGENYG